MKCSKYPERDAAGVCAFSGKPFCAEELVEVQGKMYAKDNLGLVMAEVKEKAGNSGPIVFMNAGGAAASSSAAASAAVGPQGFLIGTKSKTTAVLLAFFLGGIGAHKFYLGQWFWGLLYLVFCWTGVPAIIGIIEALNYAFMSQQTFYRRYG